jgi:hypothetical protein
MCALPLELALLVCQYYPAGGLALEPDEQVILVERLTKIKVGAREAYIVLTAHALDLVDLLGPTGIDIWSAAKRKGKNTTSVLQNLLEPGLLAWSGGCDEINDECVDWLEVARQVGVLVRRLEPWTAFHDIFTNQESINPVEEDEEAHFRDRYAKLDPRGINPLVHGIVSQNARPDAASCDSLDRLALDLVAEYLSWCAPKLPIHWSWLRQQLASHMPAWRELPLHDEEDVCAQDCAVCEAKWDCAICIRELLIDNSSGLVDDERLWELLDRAR